MSDDLSINQQAKNAVMQFKGANVSGTAIYDDSVSTAHLFDISSFFHRFIMTNIITPMDITLPSLANSGHFSTSYYICNFDGADGSSIDFYPDANDSINELAPGSSLSVNSAGNVFIMFIFSYQQTWYIGLADQPITIQGGPGIVVTGGYPDFTVSLAAAEYFTFTYGPIIAQNYAAGLNTCTLFTQPFTETINGGTDWEVGVATNTLQYVGVRPKIYMINAEVQQDSSTTNFRPQIYITREGIVLNGNGLGIATAGISTGQLTAINSFSSGVFITIQPNQIIYFSVINGASGSPAAGVSTNFAFSIHLAEAR